MPLARNLACLVFMVALVPSTGSAQGRFYLKNGDRVVFYGDSITDQRLYTTFTESYVLTRFPRMNVKFVHSGWGGDRVTGGGGGPIDLRLKRDVFAYNPTVMTIMLGMNDASYRPYDANIFHTYASGYQHIIETVKSNVPGIRITAIQPSPFDDVTRPPSFEGGYNAVLVRYGDFLKDLASKQGLHVADLNTSVVAALQKARAVDEPLSQKLIQDRVHPGPAGQLLMAAALLKAWNAPAVVSNVEIDAASRRAIRQDNTRVSEVAANGSGLSWTQADGSLPFPLDLNDSATQLALKSSDFVDSLDRQTIRVTGLTAPEYTLRIDGQDVGAYSRDHLASGVNLSAASTPMLKQALNVHFLTRLHNDIHFTKWRQVHVPRQNDMTPEIEASMSALDRAEEDIVKQQRAAAQPVPHRFELSPK